VGLGKVAELLLWDLGKGSGENIGVGSGAFASLLRDICWKFPSRLVSCAAETFFFVRICGFRDCACVCVSAMGVTRILCEFSSGTQFD
jgi:hypothetical protein